MSISHILPLRTVQVLRYVTPLREGGSLPAIAEADDEQLYVLKFRGAGQGAKALIAELLGGEIARHLGFRIPELVFANLDSAFGRTEPDEEIQDLLKASTGLNLALGYLKGAYTFDPAVTDVDEKLASKLVWLDAFLMNVDRTARNTNLLVWNKELWLIDHGASLYFHHNWETRDAQASKPFAPLKEHVLLHRASKLPEVDHAFKEMLTDGFIASLTAQIPDVWLSSELFHVGQASFSPDEIRDEYAQFLKTRRDASHIFIAEAQHARSGRI